MLGRLGTAAAFLAGGAWPAGLAGAGLAGAGLAGAAFLAAAAFLTGAAFLAAAAFLAGAAFLRRGPLAGRRSFAGPHHLLGRGGWLAGRHGARGAGLGHPGGRLLGRRRLLARGPLDGRRGLGGPRPCRLLRCRHIDLLQGSTLARRRCARNQQAGRDRSPPHGGRATIPSHAHRGNPGTVNLPPGPYRRHRRARSSGATGDPGQGGPTTGLTPAGGAAERTDRSGSDPLQGQRGVGVRRAGRGSSGAHLGHFTGRPGAAAAGSRRYLGRAGGRAVAALDHGGGGAGGGGCPRRPDRRRPRPAAPPAVATGAHSGRPSAGCPRARCAIGRARSPDGGTCSLPRG